MTDAIKLAERLWRHEGAGVEALRTLRSQNSLLDQSETTQAKWLGYAKIALDFCQSAQPQYLANCLRAGECHGQCNSKPCTNYGKVIVVRRCVEPKQDGIVYPNHNQGE